MGLQKKNAESTNIVASQPINNATSAEERAQNALGGPMTGEGISKPAYQTIEENKSRRILRQGVYQHALVSPALAGMQFRDIDGFLTLVADVAEKVIKLIEGN